MLKMKLQKIKLNHSGIPGLQTDAIGLMVSVLTFRVWFSELILVLGSLII